MAQVLNRETLLAFGTPAKWADRFSVAIRPHGIRIAFGEIIPDDNTEPQFHTAVVTNVPSAELLRDALDHVLETIRRSETKPPSRS